MNLFKEFLLKKFAIDFNSLSPVKQHAFKAFESFNNIAQSEIKSSLMQTAFDFVKEWVASKMLRKPDIELKQKMFQVYQDMSPLFKDIEIGTQIQAGEAIGSVKVPRVGELAKIIELVDINKDREVIKILKELIR